MDPKMNPYAPGAGTPPPALVGRDEILKKGLRSLLPDQTGASYERIRSLWTPWGGKDSSYSAPSKCC